MRCSTRARGALRLSRKACTSDEKVVSPGEESAVYRTSQEDGHLERSHNQPSKPAVHDLGGTSTPARKKSAILVNGTK